jgi:putative ABC transport system permease protein
VAGLVSYSATLAQMRDYGVLRALGLRARGAVALLVAQLAAMVGAGFLVALGLVEVLAVALPALSPTLVLTIRTGDVAQTALVAAAVTVVAGLAPLARVVRVDPVSVFRRAS